MTYEQNYLAHFGIKGQRWGVRRYQNEDGTLTDEGKMRYLSGPNKDIERLYNKTADRANADLRRINKKYDNVDLDDDRNNLAYTREVRDSWQKNYRDVLAEEIGADPSSLEGQKWLKNLWGYDILDDDVNELENKVNKRDSKSKTTRSIPDYDKDTEKLFKSMYSESEMKSAVKSIMSGMSKDVLKEFNDMKVNGKPFSELPIDQQFYVIYNIALNE